MRAAKASKEVERSSRVDWHGWKSLDKEERMARERSMNAILKGIEEVKEQRRALLKTLTEHIDDDVQADPRRTRIETLKAQNHEDVLELDENLRELRQEQREHEDFPAMQAEWDAEEERNRSLHEERARALAQGQPVRQ